MWVCIYLKDLNVGDQLSSDLELCFSPYEYLIGEVVEQRNETTFIKWIGSDGTSYSKTYPSRDLLEKHKLYLTSTLVERNEIH